MRTDPKTTDSLFKQTLDNLPDGVLLVSQSREIIYTNAAFERMWNIPVLSPSDRHHPAIFNHVREQTSDPEQFSREVARLYQSHENTQDEIHLKDGRVFSRRSAPFVDAIHGFTRIWIFTDVTDAIYADIDSLTGLLNRRAYTRRFPDFLAEDSGLICGVAILDVDNFKAYNDLYGHAAGDTVLQRIGKLILSYLGDNDLAFRIGGEEFLLACRAKTNIAAFDFFDAIRQGIEAEQISHVGNRPYRQVTASLGLTLFRGAFDQCVVFDAADKALYLSKTEGRNRITVSNIAAGDVSHEGARPDALLAVGS